jgi:hypothetical protein
MSIGGTSHIKLYNNGNIMEGAKIRKLSARTVSLVHHRHWTLNASYAALDNVRKKVMWIKTQVKLPSPSGAPCRDAASHKGSCAHIRRRNASERKVASTRIAAIAIKTAGIRIKCISVESDMILSIANSD